MDIILVAGLWMGGWAWYQVAPVLEAAGHRPVPLTLPGMESSDEGVFVKTFSRRSLQSVTDARKASVSSSACWASSRSRWNWYSCGSAGS